LPNPAQFTSNPALSLSDRTLASSLPNNSDNHSANVDYAQADMLTQMVLPEGGNIIFTYELNQFSNYWMPDYSSTANTITSGNGLRIKSIKYSQPDGTTSKTTNYSYFGGIDMIAKRLFTSYYLNSSYVQSPCSWAAQLVENSYSVDVMDGAGCFSASLLSSFQGVGYDSVTVENVNASGISNGKITTQYNNTPDMSGAVLENTLMMYIKLPSYKNVGYPDNGTPSIITTYDGSGNVVRQIANHYVNYTSALDYGARIYTYCNFVCPGPAMCYDPEYGSPYLNWSAPIQEYLIADYPIQDSKSYLSSTSETDYFGSSSINKTTN